MYIQDSNKSVVIHPPYSLKTLLLLLTVIGTILSNTITITGRIVNENSIPVEGATLTLVKANVSTVTDADGKFDFSSPSALRSTFPRQYQYVSVKAGKLSVELPQSHSEIGVKLWDIRGRIVHKFNATIAGSGTHSFDPLRGQNSLGNGKYILGITINGSQSFFSLVLVNNNYTLSSQKIFSGEYSAIPKTPASVRGVPVLPDPPFDSVASRAEYIDTIVISKDGFITKHIWVKDYTTPLTIPIPITDDLKKMVVGAWSGTKTFTTSNGTMKVTYGWYICPKGRVRGFEKLGSFDFLVCGTWTMNEEQFTMNYYAIDVLVGDRWDNDPLKAVYYYDYDVLYTYSGVVIYRLAGDITESDCVSKTCGDGSTYSADCSYDGDCGRCWYCDNGTCRYGGEGPYGCYR